MINSMSILHVSDDGIVGVNIYVAILSGYFCSIRSTINWRRHQYAFFYPLQSPTHVFWAKLLEVKCVFSFAVV